MKIASSVVRQSFRDPFPDIVRYMVRCARPCSELVVVPHPVHKDDMLRVMPLLFTETFVHSVAHVCSLTGKASKNKGIDY